MTKEEKTLQKFARQLSAMYSEMFCCSVEIDICEAPRDYYIPGKGTAYYLCSVTIDGEQIYGSYGVTSILPNDMMQEITEFAHEIVFHEYFLVTKFVSSVKNDEYQTDARHFFRFLKSNLNYLNYSCLQP